MSFSIKQLYQKSKDLLNQEVEICGWVRTRRDSKAGFSFVVVHDGSCFNAIQAVIPNHLSNYAEDVLRLSAGCSVSIRGKLVASTGKEQGIEIQADNIKVFGFIENPEQYPISPKHHSLEYLRDVAHLRVRTNTHGAVSRIRHHVMMAIHRFFDARQFFWVNTPIITASDCEGAGEMFRVSTLDLLNTPKTLEGKIDFSKDFFGKEAFLTVSGQLNVESYCLALSKVYTFGPTFRAENSNTSRHLAEFWMLEPEIAFADLNANIELAQQLLKTVFQSVLTHCEDDLAFFAERVDKECVTRLQALVDSPFTVMTYDEAIKCLKDCGKTFEYPVSWGLDLQSEHERFITEDIVKGPVVVTHYPKEIKGFYMRLNDDDKTVAAMDVLVPGIGEMIGGSQREERLSVLDARMKECSLDSKNYEWYRDLRRYGTVPHAGFGLGFERLISYITGLNNVRDVIPFPRTPHHAEF